MIMPHYQTFPFTNTKHHHHHHHNSHFSPSFLSSTTKTKTTMFDPYTEHPRTRFDPNRGVINRTDDNSYGTMKFGSRVQKTAQNYERYSSWNGGSEESGVSSPPLWKTSPTRSPNHHNPQNNYRSLSPAQRTQAVAKGQRELMEMIRNMPESSYELSLKDIVEHPRIMEQPMIQSRHETMASPSPERNMGTGASSTDAALYRREEEEKRTGDRDRNNNWKKSEKKGQISRNGSFDNGGTLLKMVFPVSWGSRNKKKAAAAGTNNGTGAKVSPRPTVDGSGKISVDKDWWKKKRLSDSRDSESGGMSSNSGSTGSSGSSSSARSSSTRSTSRHGHSCTPGCWSIFRTRKGETTK